MSSTYESLSSVYWSEREYRDRGSSHAINGSGQQHYRPPASSSREQTNGHTSRSADRTPRPTSSASSSRRRREQEEQENIGGVKCIHCDRYITGKVLQAGENSHFHPTCARCTKCGDPFGDGEEMFMQGAAIWHPRCGPGPEGDDSAFQDKLQQIDINTPYASRYSSLSSSRSRSISPLYASSLYPSQRTTPNFFIRSASHHQLKYGRSRSPGFAPSTEPMFTDLSRVYTSTYLTDESKKTYLKKPIEPMPPKSPQFHRPSSSSASRARSSSRGRYFPDKPKPGMQVMVEQLQAASSSRPKSPHMNNEEPIELSHYPDARKPKPHEKARIERDDFPAPPYPYADELEKKRVRRISGGTASRPESAASQHRSSSTVRGDLDADTKLDDTLLVDDEEEEPDSLSFYEDPQLKKEEEELSKIATGIGKIFLKEIKEREKLRAWKHSHQDPRNASRAPSAKVELPKRLRYDNPVHASPSRDADRPRPWDDDADSEMASVFRSSGGKTAYTSTINYNVVSSLRSVPRPGYGMRSMTPGVTPRSTSPFSQRSQPLPKLHSTDFGSARSEISMRSDLRTPSHEIGQPLRGVTPFSDAAGYQYYSGGPSSVAGGSARGGNLYQRSQSSVSYAAHMRRSMPNVNFHLHTNEPAKLYPYHLLMTTNYRLPPQVDRCHLERHLSTEEFMALFNMTRVEFYRLPEWKRNDMKKRVRLF